SGMRSADRATWIAEGVRMARERRGALADLAKRNPERALSLVMDFNQLADLPAEVREACEVPWSGLGSLDLQWSLSEDEEGLMHCEHQHVVYAEGWSRKAYAPQWREARQPRKNLPMQGYLLGEVLLVSPDFSRPLPSDEWDAAG